jgi:hypothetical protein
MDLFGISAIFCSTFSIFSAILFVGRPLHFLCRTLPAFKKCLRICRLSGQVVGECLENQETFVEISQKLEVSNRTIRRSQVFLHF